MTTRKSFNLGDIVNRFGGELIGDTGVRIRQVATLDSARPTDIIFLAQSRYLPRLMQTQAAAVILAPEIRDACALPRIVTSNPYAYFAKVSTLLNPPQAERSGKHRTAVVSATARIAKTASVAAHAVIGRRAQIGNGAIIGPGCFIGDGAEIGADSRLYAGVTIYHECRIGARCIVHSGAVIGSDGFGIAQDDGVWIKIPQIGKVIVGDDVEIGANTTIDRGTLEDTVIEEGVKLDNQIQIAHNVRIGAHTAIAACAGIAGSARIGRNCALGGASMIYGHITLADGVTVSAGTLIMKSLDRPGTYTGVYPFSNHHRWLKNAAHLRQLDELAQRVRRLEAMSRKAEEDKS